MDAAFYVSILRDHSEHLRKLSTDLSEKFEQLERALGEQASLKETDTEPPLTGIAELNEVCA